MSRVVCQSTKQRAKVLELSKSDHAGLRYLKVDVVMGVKLAKNCGKKEVKRLQKGDQVVMIINLATDKSWLASKITNNVIHCQIFSLFCTFVTKYKWKKKKLNQCRVLFLLLFSQFGINLQIEIWTSSILFWSTSAMLWPYSQNQLFHRLIEHFLKKNDRKQIAIVCVLC